MKLGQGQATGRKPEAHEKSDQVILVVEGELSAEIGGKPLPNEGWRCSHYPPAGKAQVHQQWRGARGDFQCVFAARISGRRKVICG